MKLPCLRIWFRNRRRLPGACWVWRGWSCGGAEGRKPDRGGKGKQRNCPCASASLLFRKLFEEIREKIILPVFIFPDYFSENFEWGFKTAGLFLHLPVHVPMGNSWRLKKKIPAAIVVPRQMQFKWFVFYPFYFSCAFFPCVLQKNWRFFCWRANPILWGRWRAALLLRSC